MSIPTGVRLPAGNNIFPNHRSEDGQAGVTFFIRLYEGRPVKDALTHFASDINTALDKLGDLEWGNAKLEDIAIVRSTSSDDPFGDYLTIKVRARRTQVPT